MTENQKTNVGKAFQYDWAMSAVGAGTIYWLPDGVENRLAVGISERTAELGAGTCISSGGFAEIKDVLAAPVNTVVDIRLEASRENEEEIPGVYKVIDKADYLENAQPLVSILVRKDDANKVHCANYFGYQVTEEQAQALEALPNGLETKEPLKFVVMEWPEGEPEKATFPGIERLFHVHERAAFIALAKLTDKGRLWLRME